MIVSFQRDFVFVKSKKTAGSTVEHVLAPLCGPHDIVTPAGLDEPVAPGGQARNFTADPAVLAAYEAALANAQRGLRDHLEIDALCRETGGWFTHMTAAQIRSRLEPDFWSRAFKFTIERHPYEKAVSQAYFSWSLRGAQSGLGFDAFFDRAVRLGPYFNSRFYLIDGRPALDRVLRYERLEEELREVAARLGLALPAALPRIKGAYRTDRRPAREILTGEQKSAIYERCREEFDFMGYEP